MHTQCREEVCLFPPFLRFFGRSRGGEVVSREAHNLQARVQFPAPQPRNLRLGENMKKYFCDFCGRDLSEDLSVYKVGSLATVEKVYIKLEDGKNLTPNFKREEFDICGSCLEEVLKVLKKIKNKSKINDKVSTSSK